MKTRFRLMNEAAPVESGSPDAGGNFTDTSAPISTPDVDAIKNFGLDPAKYGFAAENEQTNEENIKDDSEKPQGSVPGQEASQDTDEKAYLDWVNSLNPVHNGSPFKVESVDDVKNGLQMLKDYTVKTQALSEERKQWETAKTQELAAYEESIKQFNETQKQFESSFQELNQFKLALENLQKNAPDVFEEVQRAYQDQERHFKNPILDQQLSAMRAELDQVKKGLTSREDELILKNFETEKATLAPIEQSMKELGVNVEWDKVKVEWAKTGLPLEKVVGAMYFANVAKAQASKAKVAAVKAKTSAKPTSVAGKAGVKTTPIQNNGDYFAMAQQLYNQMRG